MRGGTLFLAFWLVAYVPAALQAGQSYPDVAFGEAIAQDGPFTSQADDGIPGLMTPEKSADESPAKEPTRAPAKPLVAPPQSVPTEAPKKTEKPGKLTPQAEQDYPSPIKRDTPEHPKHKDQVGETVLDDGSCDGDECGYLGRFAFLRGGWRDSISCQGWIDQGATVNVLSPRNRSNGTVGYNDRSNDYQLNQVYMLLERQVDRESDAWDIGGRVDLLYGTDCVYASARGLEVQRDYSEKWNSQRYGAAMPQAYMEVYAPWGNGVSMKLGHFYSPMGYETVTAPDNFFYSHSYAREYAEPATYTGLLGESRFGDFTVLAGMTRGWDNWEDNNNNLGFVGGVKWSSCCTRTDISLVVSAAREQADPSTDIRSMYSLVIQQKLGQCWEYVIQHDLGTEPGAGVENTTASWYGVNQYLHYTINDAWKAGMRFEWFRDENGSRVPHADRTADYFELSTGVNWTPNKHLIIRPELRYDWTGTADYNPFGDGTRSWQFIADCDLIVRF